VSAVAGREDAGPLSVLGVVPPEVSRISAGRVVEFRRGQRLGGFCLRVPPCGVVGGVPRVVVQIFGCQSAGVMWRGGIGDQRAAVPAVVVVGLVHPVIEVKIPESSALGHTSC
jgi:hypothetical protein